MMSRSANAEVGEAWVFHEFLGEWVDVRGVVNVNFLEGFEMCPIVFFFVERI
jgi:hypothetical protein